MSNPPVTLNVDSFINAFRRASVSFSDTQFKVNMLYAKMKPRHKRHGAIKHVRDIRRERMKREVKNVRQRT